MGHNFCEKDTPDKLTHGDISIVYQEDVLWPELTVDENLRIVGQLKGISEQLIDERMGLLKKLLYLEPHSNKKA
jgi:ABC-type multidrug transport system ATPase subunit